MLDPKHAKPQGMIHTVNTNKHQQRIQIQFRSIDDDQRSFTKGGMLVLYTIHSHGPESILFFMWKSLATSHLLSPCIPRPCLVLHSRARGATRPAASFIVRAMSSFAITEPEAHCKPLGDKTYIQTAGCLIIGDEVLNGKTR